MFICGCVYMKGTGGDGAGVGVMCECSVRVQCFLISYSKYSNLVYYILLYNLHSQKCEEYSTISVHLLFNLFVFELYTLY